MRIIGGRLKGKTILPPQGYKARPTTDFAKEGLFNILNNEYEIEGLKVLDLFGGTGAISYEFASRGASMVYCVEMLPLHANFIKSQAAKFGMRNLTVVRHNVFEFLTICHEKFDIIFAILHTLLKTWHLCLTRYLPETYSILALISFSSILRNMIFRNIRGS